MRIVDTHCHAAPGWYEPVESLLFQMDRYGVEQAVLIQMRGQTNNDYQFECVQRYPDRLVSVVVQRLDPRALQLAIDPIGRFTYAVSVEIERNQMRLIRRNLPRPQRCNSPERSSRRSERGRACPLHHREE